MGNLSENTVVLVGTTAAVNFMLLEDKFGETPAGEIAPLVKHSISRLLEVERLTADAEAAYLIYVVAMSMISDRTGLSTLIKKRHERGDRSITEKEKETILSLTLAHIEKVKKFSASRGK